jgi:hypothetical protein
MDTFIGIVTILIIIGIVLIFKRLKPKRRSKITIKEDDSSWEDITPRIKDIYNEDPNEEGIPFLVKEARKRFKGKRISELVDIYFNILTMLNESKSISEEQRHAMGSLAYIEPLIISEKIEFGSFKILGIPAIDSGLRINCLLGNRGQVGNIKELVDFFPELESIYSEDLEVSLEFMEASTKFRKFLESKNGVTKAEIKYSFPENLDTVLYGLSLMERLKMVQVSKRGRLIEYSLVEDWLEKVQKEKI